MADKQMESPIRNLFLRNFVHNLIINSSPEEEALPQTVQESILPQQTIQPQQRQEIQLPQKRTRIVVPRTIIKPGIMRKFLPARPLTRPTTPQFQQKQPQVQLPPPQQTSPKERIDLGKLSKILADPGVISLEVPGPGKYVLVNKGGRIEVSSLSLTKEEIESIIHEISEKTKIPVLPGVYKTALQDYLITAVISEFVGSRFIVQKRTPFLNY